MARSALANHAAVTRTIRFPAALRDKIAADAERRGRSFESQVIALLRRHDGEDVDISPSPTDILALATASLADARLAAAFASKSNGIALCTKYPLCVERCLRARTLNWAATRLGATRPLRTNGRE